MIERLLSWISRFTMARPRMVLGALSLPAALLAAYAVHVPIDLSFAGVMDRQHPEVARYFAASERYGLGGLLPLLLEGPEPVLDAALREVTRTLARLEEVRGIDAAPPRAWLLERAAWLVDRPIFDDWLARARGPSGGDADPAVEATLAALVLRRAPPPPQGSRLAIITLARDGFELALDAEDFPKIRRVAGEVLAPFGVEARFAGMPAIVTEEREATLERMRVLGPASLVLVVLMLLLIERRPAMLASIAFPMVASVACTLGVVGFIAGRFTIMESIFGVIVFGLGIDFAIHLLLRHREEQAAGYDFATSLQRSIAGTGRGIVAGAVTTSGAFLLLTLSPDPVFQRLGLAGGIGLLLCLVFLLVGLPAEWAWIERRTPGAEVSPPALRHSGFARIADLSSRAPLPVLALGALLVTAAAALLPTLRYETNLERVFSRDIEAIHTARRIHERFGIDPGPWLVAASGIEDARRITRAFEADPVFARADSLAYLFPEDLDERRRLLDELAGDLGEPPVEDGLREPGDPTFAPRSLLLHARGVGPPERAALPAALTDRFVGPDGELLVYAFAAAPVLDSAVASIERRAAQAIDPEATSMSVIYEALIGTERPWLPRIVLTVIAFIVLVLCLDLRSVRLAGLALIPVASATTVTLGLLALAGFSFNTVTLVAIPLLLGLGVDDGIHVVHRWRERPDAPIRRVVGSVARGIAMTTLTTCASVGLLLFTRHPGIESVAVVLLVGLPLCLLASVTLLPAAMAITGTRRSGGASSG